MGDRSFASFGVVLPQYILNARVAQVGIRYLRAKLPELEASGAGQLPADTLFAVLHVLKTNPEFLSNVPQAEILIKSLLKVGGWWVGAMPVCV